MKITQAYTVQAFNATLQYWLVMTKLTLTRIKAKKRPHTQERAFNHNCN